MSIKENQLPTAQEVTENNLIRTVSDEGKSENMTPQQLKGLVGGVLFVNYRITGYDEYDAPIIECDYTLNELLQYISDGKLLVAVLYEYETLQNVMYMSIYDEDGIIYYYVNWTDDAENITLNLASLSHSSEEDPFSYNATSTNIVISN